MKRKQNKIIDCLMNDAMKRNIFGCTKTAIKAVTCVKYVKYIMGNQMQKLVEIEVPGLMSKYGSKTTLVKKLKRDDDSESHKEAVVMITNLKIDRALNNPISRQEMRKDKLMNFA